MNHLVLRIINVVMYIAMVLANWGAIALPLFGRDTGAISDLFPTAISPAGYAFSIWGIIYSLLLGFVIILCIPKYVPNSLIARIGPWFILSSCFNIGWLVLWHALQITWSVVIMVALLLSLVMIYSRTRTTSADAPLITRIFVSNTFSVYLGWISVATIVNISIALYNQGWNGWGIADDYWAMALLAVAGMLAFLTAYHNQDHAYGLVIAWASIAVAVKQQHQYPTLALVAYGIATLIVLNAIFFWVKSALSATHHSKQPR